MGGSSGGYVSSSADAKKLAEAASKRISDAFTQARRIAIVCSVDDSEFVARLVANTPTIAGLNPEIIIDIDAITPENISGFGVVIGYVNTSRDHEAINFAIRVATGIRKTVLFARTNEASSVPQYVLQYRIRILFWQELVDILTS